MRISKGGHVIRTLEDWKQYAPPKDKEGQWVCGRSAYELARIWCREGTDPDPPAELVNLLRRHPDIGPLTFNQGTPECPIPFDRFRGEPRNVDLAIEACDSEGAVAITIEAKADEPFSQRVDEALAAAVERRLENPRSQGLSRIQQLAVSLFGPHEKGLPHIGDLRYQLLTATVGTLAYAKHIGSTRGILVIHEFVTKKTSDKRHKINQQDLDAFVCRLTRGTMPGLAEAELAGPILIPGNSLLAPAVRFYIGKITRNLRGGTRS